MNYNVKNSNIAILAIAFTVMMAMSQSSFAQQAEPVQSAEPAQTADINDDLFGLDSDEETSAPDVTAAKADDDFGDIPALASDKNNELELEFDNSEIAAAEDAKPSDSNNVLSAQNQKDEPANSDPLGASEDVDSETNQTDSDDALPLAEAPKSPFEKFGNAILSKVDNDLFNQMSAIEKQTTLLNLELKREEVKNRIEALRIQRQKAQEEEVARKKAEEEKLKEAEMARQLKIMEAEEKVKQKQIELEKVRQAKVLKEYMNEMLVSNQKWVEMNASLLAKIKEIEDERRYLIKDFEDKMSSVRREAAANVQKAESAKAVYNRMQQSFNAQIEALQKAQQECQNNITVMQKGNNAANPFADSSVDGIAQDAIDMSDEYAIMDITGKGNNIVAKIVNKEGTTFIVHKGSMLKGGEVVTAITDSYIAFDNKGVKSYLYTGGTVMQHEPTEAFNDAGKVQSISAPATSSAPIRNVRGASTSSSSGSSSATTSGSSKTSVSSANNSGTKRNSSPTKTSMSGRSKATKSSQGIGSFSQGMFVR